MINISNLSLNTEETSMDAVTGGCCYIYRPKGMTARRFAWLVKKGKLRGFCYRPVIRRPYYPCYKRTLVL